MCYRYVTVMCYVQGDDVSTAHEPVLDILQMHVECLLLLCQRRPMREALRRQKVYYVCRNLHYEVLEAEALSNAIEEVVQMMIRDEETATADAAAALPPADTTSASSGLASSCTSETEAEAAADVHHDDGDGDDAGVD